MKNLVNSSYFRKVLLVLVVATLGLLLKKYSSARENFNTTLTEDEKNSKCTGCEIKKNDDGVTGCTKTEDGTTSGCTGFVGFRCGVCDEYYKDLVNDDAKKTECNKERVGGPDTVDDSCTATTQPQETENNEKTTQESGSNNESTPAETTTVSSFSQSLINFKNVLNQKLGGDTVSISSNNVNSTSDIVNKLEQLLQESTIEEVNSFKNFSYNNGVSTPLPLDPGFTPLTGGNTLADYSDYQRFL